jgi:LmbE family N-acetylglucosaminyl deacetylase
MTIAPLPLLDGRVLVIAPHPDDESLGCGLLLASRAHKESLHILFVTDGSHSPERAGGASESARRELAEIREREARDAASVLGLPPANVEFLGLEDGTLAAQPERLAMALVDYVRCIGAEQLLIPFRYDRHPDHLAINRVVTRAHAEGAITARVFEYFVYSHWRLLPGADVRACVATAELRQLDPGPGPAAALKRRALECHRSQTSCFFEWQSRPVLTRELLDRACTGPELYLLQDPARPGRQILARARHWIPIAHGLEPRLKRWKDRLTGWQGR